MQTVEKCQISNIIWVVAHYVDGEYINSKYFTSEQEADEYILSLNLLH